MTLTKQRLLLMGILVKRAPCLRGHPFSRGHEPPPTHPSCWWRVRESSEVRGAGCGVIKSDYGHKGGDSAAQHDYDDDDALRHLSRRKRWGLGALMAATTLLS